MSRKAIFLLMRRAAFILLLLGVSQALMAPSAAAQVVTVTLYGNVTDSSGAAIPDASVTVKNAETGVAAAANTT